MKLQIICSIVLYKTKVKELNSVLNCLLSDNLEKKIILIDNSPDDKLKEFENYNDQVEYIFNGKNMGYGKAHNIVLSKYLNIAKYFLVLNSDIVFNRNVLPTLLHFMDNSNDVGFVMPKIKYPDGNIQYLGKLLPTPFDLFIRRFIPIQSLKNLSNQKYELKDYSYNKVANIPSLSGCFMFLRAESLKNVGLFDELFFMYFEDLDLSRRIHQKYKTILYPSIEVIHEHSKESYKNNKMLIQHLKSAFYYFNKWGWLIDKERSVINKKTLKYLIDQNSL